jgi:ornithine--oxo-acid transaminase
MITTIRGKGLLNAIIIDESKTGGHSAWDLCMLMKSKGLLVGRALKIAHLKSSSAPAIGPAAIKSPAYPPGSGEPGRSGPEAGSETTISNTFDRPNANTSLLPTQAKPTHQNIIRLAPPLVITEDEIKTALKIIKEAVKELPNLKDEKEDAVLPAGEKHLEPVLDN